MTWNAFHRRGDVLDSITKTLDARADGHLPMDLPGVAETFSDELDVVSAISLKWHARLSANIDRALFVEPRDLEGAVAEAWRTTCEQLPGIRRALDHYTDNPSSPGMKAALALMHDKEWVKLAQAAGLANWASPQAAAAGQRVEVKARVDFDIAGLPAPYLDEPTPSLVERIKAFVA